MKVSTLFPAPGQLAPSRNNQLLDISSLHLCFSFRLFTITISSECQQPNNNTLMQYDCTTTQLFRGNNIPLPFDDNRGNSGSVPGRRLCSAATKVPPFFRAFSKLFRRTSHWFACLSVRNRQPAIHGNTWSVGGGSF